MNYPFWDAGVSYGLLMATVAIMHVLISHFAIGGGFYLVVAEMFARRKGDTFRLDFVRRLSRFFILLTLVLGSLSGVGIWFTIGLISPAAIEVLIRNFIWCWAIEWTLFIVEIAAAIIYFYGWDHMSARNHVIVGWIYFVTAWLSLFVINGIITFMLTPGEWLTTGALFDGFFNPTFWPSLVLRSGISVMLAGLYALLIGAYLKANPARSALIRHNAIWALLGLGVAVVSIKWYWWAIPASITDAALERMPLVMGYFDQSFWLAGVLAILLIVFGLFFPRAFRFPVAALVMAVGIGWFGSFEWFREAIRKPYVITDYMYGNGIAVASMEITSVTGMLKQIKFRSGDDGADLFNRACGSCHTIDGYRALAPALNGTDLEFIAGTIRGAHVMKGNMPPFAGTDDEALILASHIYNRLDQRSLKEIYGLDGLALGDKVYQIRCGGCHQFGGYNDKSESLLGLNDEDYHDLLDMAGDIADEMPPFTGGDEERLALIEYLKSLGDGGDQ